MDKNVGNIPFPEYLVTDSDGAYLITNVKEMNALAAYVNGVNGEAHTCEGLKFRLANDIDFSGATYTPIGTSSNTFKGTFDGGNHTIRNITCNSSERYVGLFGYTEGATISNVNLDKCEFTSTAESGYIYIGSIVGNASGGEIKNCHVTGSNVNLSDKVNCYQTYIGGIAGKNNATVSKSSYLGTVSDSATANGHYVGGIVGYNFGGTVTESVTQASVSLNSDSGTNKYVGGIAGDNSSIGTISKNLLSAKAKMHSAQMVIVEQSQDITTTATFQTISITTRVKVLMSSATTTAAQIPTMYLLKM